MIILVRVLLTRGKNMMETISSSFSVKAMAKPPSLGTMRPVRNAPAQYNVNIKPNPHVYPPHRKWR